MAKKSETAKLVCVDEGCTFALSVRVPRVDHKRTITRCRECLGGAPQLLCPIAKETVVGFDCNCPESPCTFGTPARIAQLKYIHRGHIAASVVFGWRQTNTVRLRSSG